MFKLGIGTVFFVALAAGPSSAATELVPSFDSGWYDASGTHDATLSNIALVGSGLAGVLSTQVFFAFDLSGLGLAPIESAQLTISAGFNKNFTDNGFFQSDDPTETVEFYDVTTNVDDLVNGFGGLAAYNDLSGGEFYGAQVIDTSTGEGGMPEISINLSAAAISNLNAAIGADARFAVAATSSGLDTGDVLWSFSGGPQPVAQLTVKEREPAGPPAPTPSPASPSVVPVPAGLPLMATALGVFGVAAWRRRRA